MPNADVSLLNNVASSREIVLGYGVHASGIEVINDAIFSDLSTQNCKWLACFNPHSYAVAKGDEAFGAALQAANWLVPDGVGVLIASKLLGGSIMRRITGSDIFASVMRRLDQEQGSVFFLGSTDETLEKLKHKVAVDFPSVNIVGLYSPPFKPEFNNAENERMLSAINECNPDVLWVGMTAPKQEKWLCQHQDMLNVRFAGAIGAAFDFYAGNVKRSHPIFMHLGLEWLPRLLREPKRLWRRMLISAPIFIFDVIAYLFNQKVPK